MLEEIGSDGKCMRCDSCKLEQETDPEKKAVECWSVCERSLNSKQIPILFHFHILLNYSTCSTNSFFHQQPSKDDITDVLLDAKNIQLKQTIDGAVIVIVSE